MLITKMLSNVSPSLEVLSELVKMIFPRPLPIGVGFGVYVRVIVGVGEKVAVAVKLGLGVCVLVGMKVIVSGTTVAVGSGARFWQPELPTANNPDMNIKPIFAMVFINPQFVLCE